MNDNLGKPVTEKGLYAGKIVRETEDYYIVKNGNQIKRHKKHTIVVHDKDSQPLGDDLQGGEASNLSPGSTASSRTDEPLLRAKPTKES